MPDTHLVVDGSNIATEGRATPSLKQLDEAVQDFLKEFPHDLWTVVVDATFEHRINPSERKLYDEALAAGELVTPPAGTIGRGDKFLLQIANRAGATVFSNDSFQEFHGEYAWLFDDGRLIGGKPVPEVGWIFAPRTPVRGPRSRVATQTARKRSASTPVKKASKRAPRKSAEGAAGKAVRAATEAVRRVAAPRPPPKPTAGSPEKPAPETKTGGAAERRRGRSRDTALPPEPVNESLPFIEFIADHPVGATVEGEVKEFSSHGAYVEVGDVRCYLALKHMGDPPPNRAREVLRRGEVRPLVVQRLDAPRRGIDLALPGFEKIEELAPEVPMPEAEAMSETAAPDAATAGSPPGDQPAADQAPVEAGAPLPESEATLAQRTAAKKATKRATTRKASPTKTATKRAPAKKAAARKTTKSPTKRAPAKKAAAKKTVRKAPAAKKKATSSTKSAGRKATATVKKAARKASPAKRGSRARKA